MSQYLVRPRGLVRAFGLDRTQKVGDTRIGVCVKLRDR
jgi:hypothetical protein